MLITEGESGILGGESGISEDITLKRGVTIRKEREVKSPLYGTF